jgi:hypothetical protein
MKTAIAILLGLALMGCVDRESCDTPNITRCTEQNKIEVCTTDGVWLPGGDCNEVTLFDGGVDSWECCFVPGLTGHVCLPSCAEVGRE